MGRGEKLNLKLIDANNRFALMGNGGTWLLMKLSCNSNNCFVGESDARIFSALLIVTRSRWNGRGGSPLSHKTEGFGEERKAPVHRRRPRVWTELRGFNAAWDADP